MHYSKSYEALFIFISICFFSIELYSQETSTQEYVELINNELKVNNPRRNKDRTYNVRLSSNDYFYYYSYYQNKKIGEYRVNINDISQIEYLNIMDELYLKIRCKNSEGCSLWTTYGDDAVFEYMLLQVMDSRSGNNIKNAIRKIVLTISGIDIRQWQNNIEQIDNSRTVYYCDSQSAYAYHSTLECDGLSNCQYQFDSISENAVIQKGYRYCRLCWE